MSSALGVALGMTSTYTWTQVVDSIKGVANNGALNWSEVYATYTLVAGYYTGGTIDSRPAYIRGVEDADNRANTNSTNYKTGYNNGYSNGVTDADNRPNGNSVNYKTGYNNGYSNGYNNGVSAGRTISNLTSVADSGLAVNAASSVSYYVGTSGYYLLVGVSNKATATFSNSSSGSTVTNLQFDAIYNNTTGVKLWVSLINAWAGCTISGSITKSTECRLWVLRLVQ